MMRNMTMTLGQCEPAAGPWQVVPLARLVGMLRPGDSARAGRPWVQSDMAEAERRGIERDGGDTAAVSFWHLWMAEELSFMARQRPWTRAKVIAAGTPAVSYDPANEVVIAEADSRSPAP